MKRKAGIISALLMAVPVAFGPLSVSASNPISQEAMNSSNTSNTSNTSNAALTVRTFATELPGQYSPVIKDIKVYDRSNVPIRLLDLARDKNTIIVFYTSWCPDCLERVPFFNRNYTKYKDKLNMIFVNVVDDQGKETREKGMKYHKGSFYMFPYYSITAYDSNIEMGVSKIPAVLAYDRNGKLMDYIIESFTSEEADTFIYSISQR